MGPTSDGAPVRATRSAIPLLGKVLILCAVLIGSPVGSSLFAWALMLPYPRSTIPLVSRMWQCTIILAPLCLLALGFSFAMLLRGMVVRQRPLVRDALFGAAMCILYVLTFPCAEPLFQLRAPALTRARKAGFQLATHLEKFRSTHGFYPMSLEESGADMAAYSDIPAYPYFGYRRASPDSLFRHYEIDLLIPLGASEDRLVYWPEGGYPARMYSGSVEILGEWAYIHE